MLAKADIRVNSAHPGQIATNLGADWEPACDDEGQLLSPEAALAQ